ncbi:MAG: hypothetical protein IT393_00070 [Nitrospirae bacterium]|nr:hypothetical protein [Nitrospirota bacterium]
MKTYLTYEPNQLFFIPPSLREWLPEAHLVYFVKKVEMLPRADSIQSVSNRQDQKKTKDETGE